MGNNNGYMDLALRIAFENMGKTSPNPSVGAVIVKNGAVVSTGGTSRYGLDHAEVVAMKNARNSGTDLAGAEMYVTLEPCNHHGKTPPCTEAIIQAGISRVYFPILDPNPLVCTHGASRLKNAGIDVVVTGEYSCYASDLIRPFKKYIETGKPFVISKSAVTLDGRIATKTGDSKWISSVYSRYVTHKLRAKCDAVMVGKNTFRKDNPGLNVRLGSFDEKVRDYFSGNKIEIQGRENILLHGLINFEIREYRDPLRVVAGLPEDIDIRSNLFHDDNYLIFAREKDYHTYLDNNKNTDLNIILNRGKNGKEEVDFMLKELAGRGVMTLLIEGGGHTSGAFLDAGEIDQFFYFIAPRVAGSGLSSIDSTGYEKISDTIPLHDISCAYVMGDIIYTGYKEPCSYRTQ